MANPVSIDDAPLLCPEAIERFDEILTKESIVFEQGSGGSTAWIAKRAKFLSSVEHSEKWFIAVSKLVKNFDNVRLCFIPLGAGKDGHRDPFGKYLMSILDFPNDYFDIVYVDGWDFARLPCLGYAKSKIKPGGFAVLDDTNWKWLRAPAYRLMEDWEIEEVTGLKLNPTPSKRRGKTRWVSCGTTFFRKPAK